ncbi:MAG: C45 family autoproteolytic acyltransferase/hydrolase [Loktanella sp.]|jgi:predicted choloylglycine hydrolase|nr:C45 family autoproteolytic acyltransferase/hydrolase [Loktanella sp.]MDO7631740.1 C45 family autoproteolytic acyltransferase/hydrolase [Loktanella sp.]MDO7666452.1 C45 family autoproteolytic acyltransferase/hydrolase [Loktanella sp.]MDO7685254.1 C45 family autoproteolytic acyltransferase/hydrolase [Loktanella sp.]MDO7725419.1 C45 family autoproteolytic acyltransferase/hydrolase [Loktanella sp.]
MLWRAIKEELPGPKWAGLFHEYWPHYKKWWLKEGVSARPTYTECHKALSAHMPEMVPIYEDLCDLAGGGDLAARFLSFYCPPPYLTGCSQAIWTGKEPVLVRNYDYNPKAFDSLTLQTGWGGRRVIGTSDGLFGLVDGMNDAGLAISLTFGGRRDVGIGFGVPLILRYVLQTCKTAEEAGEVLSRVPTHMSYNVTVIDKKRKYLTAMLAPDRPAILTHAAVATNHQETVEWISHARITATVERERYLLQRIALHRDPEEKFIGAFLRPPLYSTAFSMGFGTLYTAVYRPRLGQMEVRWPDVNWKHSFDDFQEGARQVMIPGTA